MTTLRKLLVLTVLIGCGNPARAQDDPRARELEALRSAVQQLEKSLQEVRAKLADHEGMDYNRWRAEHIFLLYGAQAYVGNFLATFKEYPPSQKPGSFSIDQALERLQQGGTGQ
jgi:hypothetical protein